MKFGGDRCGRLEEIDDGFESRAIGTVDGGQQPKRLGLGAAFFVLPGQIDCLRGRCLGFSKVTGQKDCFRQCRERKCVSGSRFGKGVAGNRRFEERESLSDLPDTGLGATEGSHDS